jgi:hypothetical protein
MNDRTPLNLRVLPGTYSVCKLPPDAAAPAIGSTSDLFSITRTRDELSVVCPSELTPTDCVAREDDFRVLEVEGPLDFALTGILSSILSPLAASQISIFTISTFNTDYILVRATDLDRAIDILQTSKTARTTHVG